MIGGEQAGIAPMDMPSGWHNLGLTPVRPYAPERDPVFLFAAGDEIVFEPVDASRWDALEKAARGRRAGRRGDAPMTDLVVKACGPMTTLQDRGRLGYQGFGVSPSGAMDRRALAMANVLVGNPPETAAIEFMNLGGSFTCEGGDLHIALVGAGMRHEHRRSAGPAPDVRDPEGRADLRGRPSAHRHLRLSGRRRRLCRRAAARQPVVPSALPPRRPRTEPPSEPETACPAGPRGAGARADAAAVDSRSRRTAPSASCWVRRTIISRRKRFALFLESEFTVSPQADRMGFQLTGPRLEHAKGFNIVSDGIVDGHIQVPGSGQPIVLMRDRQTAGGYPKIATVISADLGRFAQLRPGSAVRFKAVERDEAVAAARAAEGLDRRPAAQL